MTHEQILITGGAGFIGSHLAQELLKHGYGVRILDSLAPQVHGEGRHRPVYLPRDAELIVGDIRDPILVRKALEGVRVVFHLVAAVGVGQSMYELAEYTSVNNLGTALLLEELIKRPVRRLMAASSMSIYGEGLYRTRSGAICEGKRTVEQLKSGDWEVRGPSGETLYPAATPESKPPSLNSIYALSKFDQERMCLMIGRTYGIATTALRFFNAYGPNQSLSNPYTGVLAIFASRLLNGRRPLINEDGNQKRDFVHVTDVARACRLALETDETAGQCFNVASGKSVTILQVAERLAHVLDKSHLQPQITNRYRSGDIRHCFADISRARDVFGYIPQISFDEGLRELGAWLETRVDRRATHDRVDESRAELEMRGLMV